MDVCRPRWLPPPRAMAKPGSYRIRRQRVGLGGTDYHSQSPHGCREKPWPARRSHDRSRPVPEPAGQGRAAETRRVSGRSGRLLPTDRSQGTIGRRHDLFRKHCQAPPFVCGETRGRTVCVEASRVFCGSRGGLQVSRRRVFPAGRRWCVASLAVTRPNREWVVDGSAIAAPCGMSALRNWSWRCSSRCGCHCHRWHLGLRGGATVRDGYSHIV